MNNVFFALPGLLVILVLTLADTPHAIAQPSDSSKVAVRAIVEPSIVYLQFWTKGDEKGSEIAGFGTGFIVADSTSKKWILTSAHSLGTLDPKSKIVSVTYRTPLMTEFRPASGFLVDEKHELAAIRPHPAYKLTGPALALVESEPKPGDIVYAIGSPSALDVTSYGGEIANPPISVREIAKRQSIPMERFRPWAADLVFVQHSVPIAGGFSGCPIVNPRGKVIGLQSSTLRDANFFGFAVHYSHIREFDWNKVPQNLSSLDLSNFNAGEVLRQTSGAKVPYKVVPVAGQVPAKGKEPPPVKVKLGGVEVEAPFVHNGYVEKDAQTVIEKYIQDKEYFTDEKYSGMRVLRLQELLNKTSLARISNPNLGFQMLVPKGYRYGAIATTNPDGLLVTFRPPEDRKVSTPYDWPLSIWVRVEPDLFAKGRSEFQKAIKTPKYKLTDEERNNPGLLAANRDRYVNAVVADNVEPKFVEDELELRIQTDPTDPQGKPTFKGNPKSEPFRRFMGGEGVWMRANYQSVNGQLSHLVKTGGRDPLVLIVHYQYTKESAIAFGTLKGVPDPTHFDYAIIASSVSAIVNK